MDAAAQHLLLLEACTVPADAWLSTLPEPAAAQMRQLLAKEQERDDALASDAGAPTFAFELNKPGQILLMRGSLRAPGRLEGMIVPLALPDMPAEVAASRPAVDARDQFVASISHELRTPLNAILGFARLARADWPDGADSLHLDHIEQASGLMLRVVNDLLDLTRLESGKLDIEPDQPLFMAAVVSRVGAVAASLRQDKAVRLYATVDPACPRKLRGDVGRIEQILLNLVANALKFTDRGRVVIDVKRRALREHSVVLRMSVSDTGAGITLDQIERIGQPFERATDLSLPRVGGTGLGLAVVNRLLELHGTALRVASVPGGGSIFWFDIELPFDVDEAPSAPVADTVVISDDERLVQTVATQWAAQGRALLPAGQLVLADRVVIDTDCATAQAAMAQAAQAGCTVYWVSAGQMLPGSDVQPLPLLAEAVFRTRRDDTLKVDPALQGLKVLAVEDNALNQHVLREFLHRLGVDVAMLGEGRSVAELIGQRHFDLILLDIQLPDLSGWEIARAIRSLPNGKDLPIVFLSAHIDASDQLAAAALGALACLTKPFDAARLHALLRDVAVKAGVARRAFQPAKPVSEPARQAGKPQLVRLFASQWPSLKQGIEHAPDTAALRQAVHALRGSLAVLGLPSLVAQARAIEEAILAGQSVTSDTCAALLLAIDQHLQG
ncbi:MAG TPA: ATP-binding protein [Aquabacterium sp.]|uniref:hybrid sensor histidine kinase/response regulator n=1 Tax=Aquabacterium sp. TaxID=1872578 RepID=UPI002E370EC1|nr:ATP-binding protein [Aquabacterium sp.]HEX5356468.1 ATP-binding protein [Aquabacterium sp.]